MPSGIHMTERRLRWCGPARRSPRPTARGRRERLPTVVQGAVRVSPSSVFLELPGVGDVNVSR